MLMSPDRSHETPWYGKVWLTTELPVPVKNDARLKIDRSVWSFEIWQTAALMLILKRGSKQRGRKNLMDIILTAFVS